MSRREISAVIGIATSLESGFMNINQKGETVLVFIGTTRIVAITYIDHVSQEILGDFGTCDFHDAVQPVVCMVVMDGNGVYSLITVHDTISIKGKQI